MGQIGPKARSSVPALRDALADTDAARFAAVALGRIGTDDALAALRDAASNHADPEVRRVATEALQGK